MEIKNKSAIPSDKSQKSSRNDSLSQMELALLVIAYYLKMPLMVGDNNSGLSLFMLKTFYFLGKIIFILRGIKEIFLVIFREFHNVIVLKQQPWETVNKTTGWLA
jgi:hypothetical protein